MSARRKPPSDTGPAYDRRLELARADTDALRQKILDEVLASKASPENTPDQETAVNT